MMEGQAFSLVRKGDRLFGTVTVKVEAIEVQSLSATLGLRKGKVTLSTGTAARVFEVGDECQIHFDLPLPLDL